MRQKEVGWQVSEDRPQITPIPRIFLKSANGDLLNASPCQKNISESM